MAQSVYDKAVPAGYTLHREATAEILIAGAPAGSPRADVDAGAAGADSLQNGKQKQKRAREQLSADQQQLQVFVNPIQEFNRDISIVAIRAWSEFFAEEKRAVAQKKQAARKQRQSTAPSKRRRLVDAPDGGQARAPDDTATASSSQASGGGESSSKLEEHFPKPYKFTLFEGLSATGLRSIRYAKEIPLLRWVQANDLSAKAADNIRLNAEWNGLTAPGVAEEDGAPSSEPKSIAEGSPYLADAVNTETTVRGHSSKGKSADRACGKVRVSQGDCCSVLYAHRAEKDRFDVVDLDPYGTAAPFLDGSVQAVSDGGLLCVTCTDLAVLAGTNYPEKCYSNYGGVCVKAEYTHEVALRLLVHALSSSAARYGRYIEPVLCLSIDYYVRVFVRINSAPIQVKKAASKTAVTYVCTQCHATHVQPLGKSVEKTNQANGSVNVHYGLATGPPMAPQCEECQGRFQLGGPMWMGRLQDPHFIDAMLRQLHADDAKYGTATRIKGMLTIARNELLDVPFYFTPAKVAGLFHITCPPLTTVASALLNGNFQISRSHACPGSIKTNAPTSFVFDVMRKWAEQNPAKMANIKENSPARALLGRSTSHEIDLTYNKQVERDMLLDIKLVRYQQNPTVNWGPQAKAGYSGESRGEKRKEQDT